MDLEERVERVAADGFWTPSYVTRVKRPEVMYTSSPKRKVLYNSVPFVRTTSMEESQALVDEVVEAHGGEGKASQWVLSSRALESPGLVDALVKAGYMREDEFLTLMLEVAQWDRGLKPTEGYVVRRVETFEDLIAFYEAKRKAVGRLRMEPDGPELRHELSLCSGPDARVRRFVALRAATQEPVAVAAMNISRELDTALFWGGGTIPGARGKGLYSTLLAHRVEEARALGIRWVGVFARSEPSSAILFKRGFHEVGSAVYYSK